MVNIYTEKGDQYSFNEETGRVIKNGIILPSFEAEPVYSKGSGSLPTFSGLFLRALNAVLTRSGKLNILSDINTL